MNSTLYNLNSSVSNVSGSINYNIDFNPKPMNIASNSIMTLVNFEKTKLRLTPTWMMFRL